MISDNHLVILKLTECEKDLGVHIDIRQRNFKNLIHKFGQTTIGKWKNRMVPLLQKEH